MLNMSQNAYSLLESGKTKLDIERLYQIAWLYEISIYELLGELPPQTYSSIAYGKTK
jgi:transcriptional regulator with XRE-family HTH domain